MTAKIPDYLKGSGGKGPGLILGPEAKPKEKAAPTPRPQFDFKPVVHAPALRRLGCNDPLWLLAGDPRPVQVEALRRSINGFALFDGKDGVERFRVLRPVGFGPDRGFNYWMEMRLGKTYTIVNDFMIQRLNNRARWLIVVVPNFLKEQWALDLKAVGFDMPVHVFNSVQRSKADYFVKTAKGGAIIVNYEAFNSKLTEDLLSGILREAMIAADESIKLKNLAGVQTKALVRLSESAPRAVNASGKPLTQGPQDLLGQLHFARQALNWRPVTFLSHFAEKGGHKGLEIIGAKNVDELQRLYAPRTFLARFNEWYDGEGIDYMPPRYVDLTALQKSMLVDLEKEMMVEIGETSITAEQILVRNMKMQQVRSGFIFDNAGVPHTIVPWQENPLFTELRRILDEEIDRKVILVAYYKPTMLMLLEALKDLNPAVIWSASWHKEKERPIEGEKARYNNDPGTRVMVAQETNLTYGHTLMGTPTDPTGYLLFVEQTYSLNDRSQAEKRPQGVGQSFPVGAMDFFASELDRKKVLALQRKEDVAAVVLNFARDQGVLPYAI